MSAQRYTVRRLHLLPLAKFGCLLGGLTMFLPGLICAVVSAQFVSALSVLLEQWRDAEVDIGLGLPLGLDFVELLGLETIEMLVSRLGEQSTLLAVLVILIFIIVGGLVIGLSILVLGWVYNGLARLTGGLEIELQAKPGLDSGA
ncbi:MAG TPA: hypothetical protein VGD99_07150 [Anaerolineae bacterium]